MVDGHGGEFSCQNDVASCRMIIFFSHINTWSFARGQHCCMISSLEPDLGLEMKLGFEALGDLICIFDMNDFWVFLGVQK